MPRRVRDYKAEYAARIAKGLARGLTRSQARGHGAERKGAVGASKGMSGPELKAYLGKLKQGRSVKVMATLENGRVVELARGKPGPMLDAWTEWDAEGGPWEWDRNYKGQDSAIVSVQVIYS
jgi:hypothetical protein